MQERNRGHLPKIVEVALEMFGFDLYDKTFTDDTGQLGGGVRQIIREEIKERIAGGLSTGLGNKPRDETGG